MRQKVRKILLYTSLFLFPLTMNYLSPYVSIDGAFAGVLSSSATLNTSGISPTAGIL